MDYAFEPICVHRSSYASVHCTGEHGRERCSGSVSVLGSCSGSQSVLSHELGWTELLVCIDLLYSESTELWTDPLYLCNCLQPSWTEPILRVAALHFMWVLPARVWLLNMHSWRDWNTEYYRIFSPQSGIFTFLARCWMSFLDFHEYCTGFSF